MKHTSNSPTRARKEALSRVAAKLFLEISIEWDLTEDQRMTLAGLSSRTSLNTWRKKVLNNEGMAISKDRLERLSYIAGIYKAIQLQFGEPTQGKEWIRRPNVFFGGSSALSHMLGGQVMDIADVRRHLDSQLV